MATIDLRNWSQAQTIINNVASPTSAPNGNSDIYATATGTTVSFISGTGTGTLQLWVHDGAGWYKGDTYDVAATPVAVTWDVPSGRFTFQATAVTGGNLTVKAL